jgi:hypothetical protein
MQLRPLAALAAALTLSALLGCGGGGTPGPDPTPTPSPGGRLTRAELLGTWKILSIKIRPQFGAAINWNASGSDEACPQSHTHKDTASNTVPFTVGCAGSSTFTFLDSGELTNGAGQAWLTNIINNNGVSGANDAQAGWTIEDGAAANVVRITMSTKASVVASIPWDTVKEGTVAGKLRIRMDAATPTGVGAFADLREVEYVLEKS